MPPKKDADADCHKEIFEILGKLKESMTRIEVQVTDIVLPLVKRHDKQLRGSDDAPGVIAVARTNRERIEDLLKKQGYWSQGIVRFVWSVLILVSGIVIGNFFDLFK